MVQGTSCRFQFAVLSLTFILGGDYLNNDGSGSASIYGRTFADENFTVKHTTAGLLSMANSGPNTNGCQVGLMRFASVLTALTSVTKQFFITTQPAEFLDNKHVVFGKVVDSAESMLVLRKIENVPVGAQSRPKLVTRIIGE